MYGDAADEKTPGGFVKSDGSAEEARQKGTKGGERNEATPAFQQEFSDEVGIPALDVIRWATKHGAELMGRGHELGTVTVGKLADLVVVDGDPLTDLGLLADGDNLVAVVQGGRLVKDQLPDRPRPSP